MYLALFQFLSISYILLCIGNHRPTDPRTPGTVLNSFRLAVIDLNFKGKDKFITTSQPICQSRHSIMCLIRDA